MMKYWIYFRYLLKHKFYIWKAAGIYPIPFYLVILHDIDKFDLFSFYNYANYYYGDVIDKEIVRREYFKHEHWHTWSNKHHWQYWNGGEVPNKYLNEMLCDWYASSMAKYGVDNTHKWYLDNRTNMLLSRNAQIRIDMLLYGQ